MRPASALNSSSIGQQNANVNLFDLQHRALESFRFFFETVQGTESLGKDLKLADFSGFFAATLGCIIAL